MDGAMGQEEDVVEAVLTCEGDFHDPELSSHIERFRHRLKDLLLTDKQKLQVKKVEPWNSVKVTVTIPREAAIRLRQLAQAGNDALRQIGVLSVHIQGDSQISLTLAGRNNEQTQLVLRTPSASQGSGSSLQLGVSSTESNIPHTDELGSSSGAINDESARKNIVDYLRHSSTALRPNATLFDSILGAGATSAAGLGLGLGISPSPDSFPVTPGSSSGLRPNNMATTVMQSQGLRGSQISSSFPFTKTPGAFHPPVPRLPTSAGQSSATNPSYHMPSGSNIPGRLMGPLGQDSSISQLSLSVSGSNRQELTTSINTFSPVNHGRHLPVSSSINFNSDILHVPPSSSPSNFMMDLPPPPPYPHSTNASSRPGKPVTASSPLLVNLLQTDPLAAAAGMASGNPNKPMTAGDSGGTPPKKKRRSKKVKDVPGKQFSFGSSASSSEPGPHQQMHVTDMEDSRIPKVSEDSPSVGLSTSFSVDLGQSRAGVHSVSHIPDSFTFRPDNNSSFSADRPFSESHVDNPSSSGIQSDSNSRSAIGAGTSSSKHSDSNGQESFPQDLDPFTLEIAAGKIINPYTGQLEPRDSVVDSGQVRGKDQSSHSQGDHFATRMLAKKAKELEEINKTSVPNSSSPVLDVHVVRTAIPQPVSVSTSTAAIVRSGGPAQGSSDKFTSSVPSHSRNFITDSSAKEVIESSIYAVNTKPWQIVVGNSDAGPKASVHASENTTHLKATTSASNSLQNSYVPTAVPINGPLAASQTVKRNVIPSQSQHIGSSSYPSGASAAPSGSVIYSNVTLSSSLPLPSSHPTSVALTQGQHPTGSLTTVTPSLQTMQTSPSRIVSVSSSITPLSRTGSTLLPHSSLSVVQTTERLTSVESGHLSCDHQAQAASSESRDCVIPKSSSPNLLNSLPDRHMDSQSSTESPPDHKVSSEGDENSNHSVIATDNLPEHSGTAALLEHSGVKTENHDSGVGSSSERSDDTPSEPGDEFRSGHTGGDTEDGSNKTSLQKTVNCKLESKASSTSNTITVGYIMSPSDNTNQSKLTLAKDTGHFSKTALINTPATSDSDISELYDSHIKSMEKQTDLVTSGGHPTSSVNWVGEESKGHSYTSIYGKVKENGPSSEDLGNIPGLKMNGPSSQGSIDKMIITMNDLQQKKMRSSPKHSKLGLDVASEHLKLPVEVFEKISKLHQFAESAKESSEMLSKTNSSDKADSPDSLSRLGSMDDHADQLIFDMEELVNGKTLGHGMSGMEGKGGSNITSIYSKRSSPVNVNMLNHIYAPGLPLPRRLTESVQRLVKPLPASETSISVPQMRPCKSPSSSSSPRTGSGTTSQNSLRMSVQSGARSPGASMPKLITSDKHSLLSGGLDLAGLSSLQYTSVPSTDQSSLGGIMVNCKKGMPRSADVLLKDSQSLSLGCHSPPNLLLDSKSYSGKMLSQSYPPHKSRDLQAAISNIKHDLLSNFQLDTSAEDKNSLPSQPNSQHNQSPKSTESPLSPAHDSQAPVAVNSSRPPSSIHSNHVSMSVDSASVRIPAQPSTPTEHSHSSNNTYTFDSSNAYASHSNCSSPVMPVLQRGQEPPVTPTLASNMPTMSSQQPPTISPAKEISRGIGSSAPPISNSTVTTFSKHVPYSNNTVAVASTVKSPTVSSLPVLFPVSLSPVSKAESKSTSSAPPKLLLSSAGNSTPPKLTKVHTSTGHSPQSQRSGNSSSQFSRNLFESVSGTFNHECVFSGISEQAGSNSLEISGQSNTQYRPVSSDSQSDSSSSVLTSVESKVDFVMKNMLNKPADNDDPIVSTSGSKQDVLKSYSHLKAVPMVSEIIKPQTKVISLDLPTPSLNSESAVEAVTTSSVTRSEAGVPKAAVLASAGPSTEANFTPSVVSQSVDTVAEVIASVAAGRDESTLKATALSGTTSPSLVKEPILETLATALASTAVKPMSKTSVKSFVEKQVSAAAVGLELRHRPEEDGMSESKMVTIQSGPQKLSEHSSRYLNSDFISAESNASHFSDALNRRTRKRKSAHSEGDSRDGDSEISSTETTPIKQTKLSHGPSMEVKPPHKTSSTTDGIKPSVHTRTDAVENKDGKSLVTAKPVGFNVESHDKTKADKNPKLPLLTNEEKESIWIAKSHKLLLLDDKEQMGSKEGKIHKAANSGSSDDRRSSRSSSTDGKESTHKDNKVNRNNLAGTNDSREGHSHHSNSATSVDDKDQAREGRSQRAMSVDHKENAHRETSNKDSKNFKGLSNAHEDKEDQKESRSRSASAEDRDKMKGGRDSSAEKTSGSDKGNPQDDGGKKGHRIRRQFYAYVPEKSIDQTYFDTPILSGRTRSKNKTSDQQEGGMTTQDSIAPHQNSTDTQTQHSAVGGNQHSTAGKSETSGEGAGGKRPTRSVRVKDNPSDQNANKRRRIQHR